MMATRVLGIAVGVCADALWGDPDKHHPVAWFGTWAGWLERQCHADSTTRGLVYALTALAPVAALGPALERVTRHRPLAHVLATGVSTWAVLGARSLAHEGRLMADHLDQANLADARTRLTHLCGRDPSALDEAELCRAAVESMAENTADAVVASLFWGATCGVPGLLLHRGVNTLDAMVGHRSLRHAHFGTAAARLDDAADLLPARLTGALACALAPLVGGSTRRAWRIMRRDGHRHPSPNGGWCESAWAGALGVRLGGRNVYASRVEVRPILGEGPRPGSTDVRRAARLVTAVGTVATLGAVGALLTTRAWVRRGRAAVR